MEFLMRLLNSILIILFFYSFSSAYATTPSIEWKTWADSNFDLAKIENRFVILDLEAVWCHWCHVMDQKTYQNAKIIEIIQKHFIAVKVDQDSRPDLSNRYQDYGWPATIIFNAKGQAVGKLAGFIPPDKMLEILQKTIQASPIATPTNVIKQPDEPYSNDPYLSNAQRTALTEQQTYIYDDKNKGWGGFHGGQKYLDPDVLEFAIVQAEQKDTEAARMAKETLNAQLALLDPTWGGMYQYSTDGDWIHPHFEKIMSFQAEDMRIYALAYELWHSPEYLQTAEKINDFLMLFLLSPNGAFYTSQNADVVNGQHRTDYFKLNDKQRRQQGIPSIDKHIYARENGWAINGVTSLYMATGNPAYLAEAEHATTWIIKNRSLKDGGFSHDAKDVAGPYLGDTLAMGRAFLSLYQATGNRRYLSLSENAAHYIDQHFKNSDNTPGFFTAAPTGNTVLKSMQSDRGENVVLARLTNLLYQYTGNDFYKKLAENAMRYLATPSVAANGYPAPILLADREITQDPLHITIIGHKDDANAQSLYRTALAYPSGYKRIEWWDINEGKLPNPDVSYPLLNKTAGFVCTNHRCSLPVFTALDLEQLITKLTRNTTAVIQSQNMGNQSANINQEKNKLNSLNEQDSVENLLTNKNWYLIIISFLGFGLLLAFTPCVLPMIPILVSIIVGQGNSITSKKAFSLSLIYVLAMATTYACAGIIAGLAGSYIQAYLQNPWILAAFCLIFLALALSLFGLFELQLPVRLQQTISKWSHQQKKGNYFSVAMMGILATLIASPCVTAPLVGILSYIAKTGNATLGAVALFFMGVGMGIPLLIIGTIGGHYLPKSGPWMENIKKFFGFLLLGLAIWIIQRVIPAEWTMLLWATLVISIAIYMGVFSSRPISFLSSVTKILSVLILMYGLAIVFGAFQGNQDPLEPISLHNMKNVSESIQFQQIQNISEFKTSLSVAKTQHKPIMLDFYAQWCTACKEMEKNTFTNTEVKKLLKGFILLRIDLTNINTENTNLAKHFNVIAPPATLFFDKYGKEFDVKIVGDIGSKKFIQVLQQISR
jgi:thiol:disulfide interchange protein